MTPLHYAVLGENTQIVQYLLQNNPDPHIQSLFRRETPLDLAKRKELNEIADLIEKHLLA